MQNPDPRDKQSCGKFEVVKHGDLWTVDRQNRGEKVECVEGTRRMEIKQVIAQEDFVAS